MCYTGKKKSTSAESKKDSKETYPVTPNSNGSTSAGTSSKSNATNEILYKVDAYSLNLRECAGIKCKVLQELPYGKVVKLIENSGIWKKVEVVSTGAIGYVYSAYISKN